MHNSSSVELRRWVNKLFYAGCMLFSLMEVLKSISFDHCNWIASSKHCCWTSEISLCWINFEKSERRKVFWRTSYVINKLYHTVTSTIDPGRMDVERTHAHTCKIISCYYTLDVPVLWVPVIPYQIELKFFILPLQCRKYISKNIFIHTTLFISTYFIIIYI